MPRMKIGEIKFSKVYPMYVQKAQRKGRTKEEVDEVIRWLTGYDDAGIEDQIARETDFATLFAEAPALNPNASKITGVICGYRVEEIEDPIEQKVRWMDKLVDEVAGGKKMEKINRG
jgi:hypothetical protein